jgi:metal-sulfur cluster biosynthetic enzyme
VENQIRTELAAMGYIKDFRIDWQWIPEWRPADFTDDGRDQLRSTGFTI